ncbi:MAG: (2Fe-2S)-binding protein [Acidobacteriota bacterium]
MAAVTLMVNGAERRTEALAEESLLDVLRNRLDLTGTKYGCGEGQCGACTVLLDGRPVRSCQTRAAEAAGKKITTIEGLEQGGRLHPVQAAFLEAEAFQCAYCTSGMILSAAGLLQSNPSPSEQEIAGHMAGNICRCGVYPRILAAVAKAAQAMGKGSKR